MRKQFGILYAVTGTSHTSEANRSASSLRTEMQDVGITLVTDDASLVDKGLGLNTVRHGVCVGAMRCLGRARGALVVAFHDAPSWPSGGLEF